MKRLRAGFKDAHKRTRHAGFIAFIFTGALAVALASAATACVGFPDSAPQTNVILDNLYPADSALVVYDASWLNVSFHGQPVMPGAQSSPQSTVPASDNPAYVVLAPGWVITSTTPPTSLMVIESTSGFAVALGDTLHIPVDDRAFEGNCAVGRNLHQDEADFLTQIVFSADFAGLRYDASTCTTSTTSTSSTTPMIQMGATGAH